MDGVRNFNQSRASSIGPVRSRGRGAWLAMHVQTTPPRVRPMDEFGSHDHGHQLPPSQPYYQAPSHVPDTFLHQVPRPEHGRAMYERGSSEVEAYQDVSQSFDPAQVELALRQAGVVNNEYANTVRTACQGGHDTILLQILAMTARNAQRQEELAQRLDSMQDEMQRLSRSAGSLVVTKDYRRALMRVCMSYTAEPTTSYLDIAEKAELYIWTHAARYNLAALTENVIVRSQMKELLSTLAANARSNLHKKIKEAIPTRTLVRDWWKKHRMDKQDVSPPSALYASFAFLRVEHQTQYKKNIKKLGPKAAEKAEDRGFWDRVDKKYKELVKRYGADRASSTWRVWEEQQISADTSTDLPEAGDKVLGDDSDEDSDDDGAFDVDDGLVAPLNRAETSDTTDSFSRSASIATQDDRDLHRLPEPLMLSGPQHQASDATSRHDNAFTFADPLAAACLLNTTNTPLYPTSNLHAPANPHSTSETTGHPRGRSTSPQATYNAQYYGLSAQPYLPDRIRDVSTYARHTPTMMPHASSRRPSPLGMQTPPAHLGTSSPAPPSWQREEFRLAPFQHRQF